MTEEVKKLDSAAKDWLTQMAEIFGLLARFHDREPDDQLLEGLRESSTIKWLYSSFSSKEANEAALALGEAVGKLPDPVGEEMLDELASEFADVYLTHSYRISPSGSVWLTEDGLERQEPMFSVRTWFEKYGVEVPDWRIRSDDHIVHELQFIAHLCHLQSERAAVDLVAFLDENVLNWIPEFSTRMGERVKQPYFKAVATLTGAVLEELRDKLRDLTGIERPEPEPEKDENAATVYSAEYDRPYVPGVSESW